MKNYLFYYPYGAYGATFEQGKGKDLKEALKDARDNYFHGIGVLILAEKKLKIL
jgi:hypothetical protein